MVTTAKCGTDGSGVALNGFVKVFDLFVSGDGGALSWAGSGKDRIAVIDFG